MCAINPVHKKRFIIDVYTSDRQMTKEWFEDMSYRAVLMAEINLNEGCPKLRFHVKESDQQAD